MNLEQATVIASHLFKSSPEIMEVIFSNSLAQVEGVSDNTNLIAFENDCYQYNIGLQNIEVYPITRSRYNNEFSYAELGLADDNYLATRKRYGGALHELRKKWFRLGKKKDYVRFKNVPYDLIILPINVIADTRRLDDVGRMHPDPNFFENAFSNILCFDSEREKFVPVKIGELQDKYRKLGYDYVPESNHC